MEIVASFLDISQLQIHHQLRIKVVRMCRIFCPPLASSLRIQLFSPSHTQMSHSSLHSLFSFTIQGNFHIMCPIPQTLGDFVDYVLALECFFLKWDLIEHLNIQKTKIMASGPIISWEIDGETLETVSDFIFLGSKITADGDCSHEIKRRLLLGRKVMTNLDSILKSRDITLPTKVCLVKAMVFPVVMYGCESWTVKKAECRRIDAFELWCWRRLLRVP